MEQSNKQMQSQSRNYQMWELTHITRHPCFHWSGRKCHNFPWNVISAAEDNVTLKFSNHSSWVQLFGGGFEESGLADPSRLPQYFWRLHFKLKSEIWGLELSQKIITILICKNPSPSYYCIFETFIFLAIYTENSYCRINAIVQCIKTN